jgi:hypothetical protein
VASARQLESVLLRWLTLVSIFVGVLSTLSYSVSAAIALRFTHPSLGAWWDAINFISWKGQPPRWAS